jgi:hypothetical protein
MKYFSSARKSMSKKFAISTRTCELIKWSVIVFYLVVMVVLWLIVIISFPGYSDIMKFIDWNNTTDKYLKKVTTWIWLTLILSYTILTIVSIFLLFKQINMLKTYSTSITFNYWSMIIHMVLLVAQAFIVCMYLAPVGWFENSTFLVSRKYQICIVNLMV